VVCDEDEVIRLVCQLATYFPSDLIGGLIISTILRWTSEFMGSKIFLTTEFRGYFSRFGLRFI
jgi:hypothetical protein